MSDNAVFQINYRVTLDFFYDLKTVVNHNNPDFLCIRMIPCDTGKTMTMYQNISTCLTICITCLQVCIATLHVLELGDRSYDYQIQGWT